MRRLKALLIVAAAVSPAACAGAPQGVPRATVPAHAQGEGLEGASQGVSATPTAASGHDHTRARSERPHIH